MSGPFVSLRTPQEEMESFLSAIRERLQQGVTAGKKINYLITGSVYEWVENGFIRRRPDGSTHATVDIPRDRLLSAPQIQPPESELECVLQFEREEATVRLVTPINAGDPTVVIGQAGGHIHHRISLRPDGRWAVEETHAGESAASDWQLQDMFGTPLEALLWIAECKLGYGRGVRS